MKNKFKKSIGKMWQNVQNMSVQERKETIEYIIQLNKFTSGFVDYQGKFFMAQLIQDSECYFNGIGTTTKVKEFDNLGWYDENNKLYYKNVTK